jgi:hypothetical protein
MNDRLITLGDALENGTRADLRPRRATTRRRVALGVAVAILVPGAALAATEIFSTEDVARSMPAGTLALAGTEPSCTVVTEGVEYHCTLAQAPAPEVESWKGTVEPTVDKTQHVNGGCRSLNAEGTEWSCYLGREAVRQEIISLGFLGEKSSGPGRG